MSDLPLVEIANKSSTESRRDQTFFSGLEKSTGFKTDMSKIIKALGYRLWCSYKRRWILMSIFIAIPIVLAALFLFLKSKNIFTETSQEEGPVIEKLISRRNVLQLCSEIGPIGVSPDNADVRLVMKTFEETFKSVDIPIVSIVFKNDSDQLTHYLANVSSKLLYSSCGFGINFDQLSPSALSYSIRSVHMRGWFTNQGFPDAMIPGPMENGHIYFQKGFLAVQTAIDESYSKSFLNVTFPDWGLQGFPYPAYKRESSYSLVYLFLGMLNSYSISFILSKFATMMIQEKISGIKELLKVNGIRTWMIYSSWYFMFGSIMTFLAAVITIFWKYPLSSGALLPFSNPVVLFFILLVYYWAGLSSIGFVSSLISEPKYGLMFILLYWLGSSVLVTNVLGSFRNTTILCLVALLPNGGIYGIFEAISELEAAGSGAAFANLFNKPPVARNILPIGVNMLIMIASMFMYIFLMVYVDAIKPGPYGRAEPWYFIFNSFMGSKSEKETVALLSGKSNGSSKKATIESVEEDQPVGLKVVNLLKVFGSLNAVDNLNLTIYKNQITALLGHNGAGKSTLFNMICGMFSPSSGSVYTGDYDIFSGNNLDLFRRSLGYCPQHDLLMDELTVEQHLIFFGMVKGLTMAEAKEQCDHWTKKFKIYDGRDKLVSELSGGMKRKLCLCVSLVANPPYLLLDEPTSGLDPESRRDIWDVLLSVRGNRTIIISTHFMEEADVLGDRIAIVAHGKLRCYGTAMFLKRHYGSGYQLNISGESGVDNILSTIQSFIPSAHILNRTENMITVGLPAKEIAAFPELFRALESQDNKSNELSLSCTNMDDVFLKVQEDEGVQMTIDEVDMPTMLKETHDRRNRKSKLAHIWQQFEGFIIKRYLWAFYNWISFVFFIILLPIGAMYLTMAGANIAQNENVVKNMSLSLSMYDGSVALIAKQANDDKLATAFESIVNTSGSTYRELPADQKIIKGLLDLANEDLLNYRSKMIVALDSRNQPKALFSTLAYHSAPIVLSMLSNSFLKQANSSAQINTYNIPYKFDKDYCEGHGPNSIQLTILWICPFATAMLVVVSYFIIFPHTERITTFKHLQIMTGAQPALYWTTNLIADFTLYMIPVVTSLVILVLTDDFDVFKPCGVLSGLALVLVLFGIGSIPLGYLCSYLFKTYTSAQELFVFFSVAVAIASTVGGLFEETEWFRYILDIVPWVPLVKSFAKIIQRATMSPSSSCLYGPEAKKLYEQMIGPPTIASFGIKSELIYLSVAPFFYLVLIVLIDHGILRMIMSKIRLMLYGKIVSGGELTDLDVAGEKEAVDASRNCQDPYDLPIFVCDDLGKKFSRNLVAVHDVTFAIRKSECFGLLGVNGAGKSTTFGMLTGMLSPTKGDARILNYSLTSQTHSYLKRLGYCPQLDGLLLEMSARSLLSLFGRLRGIPAPEMPGIIQKWIDALDMTEICDRPCKGYSGGNKRKLSTALALIGDPPVVLLDEPTTGVDPVVRRKIWSILKYSREMNGQTIIITSHSMDECEATCQRLTIMVKGFMKCIGTIPRLKNVFGHGYVLLVKLVFTCTENDAMDVQAQVERSFSPYIHLQDQQHGLFNFHIDSRGVKLHRVFQIMNTMKASQQSIEDFSVSTISLEEVFLSLAKAK